MSQLRNKPTDYITNVALQTYSCEEDFLGVLEKHREDVRCLSYIVHDKDEADPHIHAIFALSRSLQVKTICGWFKKCSDVKGEACNTFAEEILSASAMEDYLTHSGAGQEGKHQYEAEDVKVLEGVADARRSLKGKEDVKRENAEKKAERKAEQADETECLLNDIIEGKPMREMARKYGRDYMKNHRAYREYAGLVVIEESQDIQKGLQIMGGLDAFVDEQRRLANQAGVATGMNEVLRALGAYVDTEVANGATYLKNIQELIFTMKGGNF